MFQFFITMIILSAAVAENCIGDGQINDAHGNCVCDASQSWFGTTKCGQFSTFTSDGALDLKTWFPCPEGVVNLKNSEIVHVGQSFQGCNKVTEVLFHPDISEVAPAAFLGCTSLTFVTFPANLHTIGNFAFRGTNIKEIDLSSTQIVKVDQSKFNCNTLEKITLSSKQDEISNMAFMECKSLKEVVLTNVVYIGDKAFYNIPSLKVVKMPSVKTISARAFQYTGIETIMFPNSLSIVKIHAFSDTPVTTLDFRETILGVLTRICDNCVKLEQLLLPETMQTFSEAYFPNSESLKEFHFPSCLQKIENINDNSDTNDGFFFPYVERVTFGNSECIDEKQDINDLQMYDIYRRAFNHFFDPNKMPFLEFERLSENSKFFEGYITLFRNFYANQQVILSQTAELIKREPLNLQVYWDELSQLIRSINECSLNYPNCNNDDMDLLYRAEYVQKKKITPYKSASTTITGFPVRFDASVKFPPNLPYLQKDTFHCQKNFLNYERLNKLVQNTVPAYLECLANCERLYVQEDNVPEKKEGCDEGCNSLLESNSDKWHQFGDEYEVYNNNLISLRDSITLQEKEHARCSDGLCTGDDFYKIAVLEESILKYENAIEEYKSSTSHETALSDLLTEIASIVDVKHCVLKTSSEIDLSNTKMRVFAGYSFDAKALQKLETLTLPDTLELVTWGNLRGKIQQNLEQDCEDLPEKWARYDNIRGGFLNMGLSIPLIMTRVNYEKLKHTQQLYFGRHSTSPITEIHTAACGATVALREDGTLEAWGGVSYNRGYKDAWLKHPSLRTNKIPFIAAEHLLPFHGKKTQTEDCPRFLPTKRGSSGDDGVCSHLKKEADFYKEKESKCKDECENECEDECDCIVHCKPITEIKDTSTTYYDHCLVVNPNYTYDAAFWPLAEDFALDGLNCEGCKAVVKVVSTDTAFAALKEDATVITWGNAAPRPVYYLDEVRYNPYPEKFYESTEDWYYRIGKDQLTDIVDVQTTYRAFAALKQDGTVVTWGDKSYGGDTSKLQDLTNVAQIYASEAEFFAVKHDGSALQWGGGLHGTTDDYEVKRFDAVKIDGVPMALKVIPYKGPSKASKHPNHHISGGLSGVFNVSFNSAADDYRSDKSVGNARGETRYPTTFKGGFVRVYGDKEYYAYEENIIAVHPVEGFSGDVYTFHEGHYYHIGAKPEVNFQTRLDPKFYPEHPEHPDFEVDRYEYFEKSLENQILNAMVRRSTTWRGDNAAEDSSKFGFESKNFIALTMDGSCSFYEKEALSWEEKESECESDSQRSDCANEKNNKDYFTERYNKCRDKDPIFSCENKAEGDACGFLDPFGETSGIYVYDGNGEEHYGVGGTPYANHVCRGTEKLECRHEVKDRDKVLHSYSRSWQQSLNLHDLGLTCDDVQLDKRYVTEDLSYLETVDFPDCWSYYAAVFFTAKHARLAFTRNDFPKERYDEVKHETLKIHGTEMGGYAALKPDGTVIVWGNPLFGGRVPESKKDLLQNVKSITASETAFAAVKHDGSVVTWGAIFNRDIVHTLKGQEIAKKKRNLKIFLLEMNSMSSYVRDKADEKQLLQLEWVSNNENIANLEAEIKNRRNADIEDEIANLEVMLRTWKGGLFLPFRQPQFAKGGLEDQYKQSYYWFRSRDRSYDHCGLGQKFEQEYDNRGIFARTSKYLLASTFEGPYQYGSFDPVFDEDSYKQATQDLIYDGGEIGFSEAFKEHDFDECTENMQNQPGTVDSGDMWFDCLSKSEYMKKCQAEYRRVVGDGSIRDVWFTPHDDETLQNVESASTTGQAFAFLRKDGSVAVAGADIRLFPHRERHGDQLEKAVYDSRVGRVWSQNFGHAGTDYAADGWGSRFNHFLLEGDEFVSQAVRQNVKKVYPMPFGGFVALTSATAKATCLNTKDKEACANFCDQNKENEDTKENAASLPFACCHGKNDPLACAELLRRTSPELYAKSEKLDALATRHAELMVQRADAACTTN